jgi:hypothetical protein
MSNLESGDRGRQQRRGDRRQRGDGHHSTSATSQVPGADGDGVDLTDDTLDDGQELEADLREGD